MHCRIAEFNNHPSRKFLLLKKLQKKKNLKNCNSFAVYGGGVVNKMNSHILAVPETKLHHLAAAVGIIIYIGRIVSSCK